MDRLKRHGWYGNVRELRNVVERSIVIADGEQLSAGDLPIDLQHGNFDSGENQRFSEFELASMEKNHIRKVLQYTRGNKTEAARLMHIGLTTLYRKIEEYGLGEK